MRWDAAEQSGQTSGIANLRFEISEKGNVKGTHPSPKAGEGWGTQKFKDKFKGKFQNKFKDKNLMQDKTTAR